MKHNATGWMLAMTALHWSCGADPVAEKTPVVEQRSPPNILLLVLDTTRADILGVNGGTPKGSPTPNLDQFASHGLNFQRAYAQSSWTLPSFASLLSGQLPHAHGVVRDPEDETRFGRLPDETQTLAERLSAAGYATGAVVNNTYLAPEFGLNQGFDHYDFVGSSNTEHRSAANTVELGLAWLDEQTKPTFLLLHMMEPHLTYDPPADLRGTFASTETTVSVPFGPGSNWQRWRQGAPPPEEQEAEVIRGLYAEEVLGVDREFGKLLEGLDARDLRGDTLIVVTSDHGEEFWDHGAFEHGHSLMGEVTRVPLIVSGPNLGLGTVDVVVQHVDLTQGLLIAAGLGLQEDLVGANLLGLAALSEGVVGDLRTRTPQRDLPSRYALSESVLYGKQRLSIVSQDHRLVLDIESGQATVWKVNAHGREQELVKLEDQSVVGKPLLKILRSIRGNLDEGPVSPGPALPPESEIWTQLANLGYIEKPQEGE